MSRDRALHVLTPIFLAVAVAVAVAGCGRGTDEPVATAFAGTDGGALYGAACARCHGVDLRGTDQGPPFIDEIYRPGHHGDIAFMLAVRQGVRPHHWTFGPMPPVPGLTDEQVGAITRFIRERQQAAGIE